LNIILLLKKLKKSKELLVYDELSLSEIAIQLNYSNVAYLSISLKVVLHPHISKKWERIPESKLTVYKCYKWYHNCVTENGHLSRIFVMLTKNSKKMTHTYIVTGMSCDGCRTKVEKTLNAIDGVQAVFLDPATATITMEKHIQLRNYKKH
jgi:copper chaperone CopZ